MFNPTPSAASIPVGSIIADKYRVERIVGKGGMGIVVAARHIKLHDSVAIKLMLGDDLGNRDSVERFLREARACAKLRNNEHIVRVTDVDTLPNGLPYMVMELLEGQDLDKLLKECGVLQVHDACAHLVQACRALGEAHQKGIIHRDLKPQNLFLTRRPDGSPCIKVLDFGISKHTLMDGPAELDLTRPSDILGSAYYMAPEQARSSRNVVPQSDIYSLGAVLYKLLTGRAPFPKKTLLEVYEALLTESPAPPSQFRKEIPRELEMIILRCLDKNADLRFSRVHELMAALAPFTVPNKTMVDDTDSDAITTLPRVRGRPVNLTGTLPLQQMLESGSDKARQLAKEAAQGRVVAISATTQPLDARSLHAAMHEYLPPKGITRPPAPSEPRLPNDRNMGFGAESAKGDSKPQMLDRGFGAKGAESDSKPQMLDRGFGAKGAESDPKPQMLNRGFGAKGAESDPKPQMLNRGFGAKGAESDPKPQRFDRDADEPTPLLAPRMPSRPAPLRDEPAPISHAAPQPVSLHPRALSIPTPATKTPLPVSTNSPALHETVYVPSAAQIMNSTPAPSLPVHAPSSINDMTMTPWNAFPSVAQKSNPKWVVVVLVVLTVVSIVLLLLIVRS